MEKRIALTRKSCMTEKKRGKSLSFRHTPSSSGEDQKSDRASSSFIVCFIVGTIKLERP
jgi:hypothetical protein